MADNSTFKDAAGNQQTLRMRDTGANVKAEKSDSAPWEETMVVGAQTLTVTNAAVTKDGAHGMAVPATATHCYVSVEVASLRFLKGEDPSTTKGHLLSPGAGPIELAVAQLGFIAQAADSTLQISYHKYV